MRLAHLFMITTSLATLGTAACKKENKDASGAAAGGATAKTADPGGEPAGELAAVLPKGAPAEFTAWELPARAKAWQGAWVTEQSLGSKIAIEVKGAAVTTWDGKAEKHLAFELESPCSAKLVEKGADGSTSSTTSHFTIKGGALVLGLGDAGSRKGKSAVACISNAVLTLDDAGTCLAWSSMFDKWKSEPGKCAFAQKDGKDVFTATVNGMETTLQIDGDAMMSEQLARVSAKSSPDFAGAKTARDSH